MSIENVPSCNGTPCPVAQRQFAAETHAEATYDEFYRGDESKFHQAMRKLEKDQEMLARFTETGVSEITRQYMEQSIAADIRSLNQQANNIDGLFVEASAFDMPRISGACPEGSYIEESDGECFRYCGSLAINEEEREATKLLAPDEE